MSAAPDRAQQLHGPLALFSTCSLYLLAGMAADYGANSGHPNSPESGCSDSTSVIAEGQQVPLCWLLGKSK